MEGGGSLEWDRQLRNGASVAMLIGVDLVKLLTMDRDCAYGVFADATVTVPLLRGSGVPQDIASKTARAEASFPGRLTKAKSMAA